MDIIGQLSGPDRINKLTEFTFGPRGAILFTGSSDGTGTNNDFVQIGWNVDWNFVNGKWKAARVLNGQPATAIRVGKDGFEVWTTSTTSGDLTGRLGRALSIKATSGEDRIVVGPNWHFQISDTTATNLGYYRLMLVPLESPVLIYNNAALNKNTAIMTSTAFGVHEAAKAVHVMAVCRAGGSAATMKIYKESSQRHQSTGIVIPCAANQENSGDGLVYLGEGAHKGKFVVERTNPFTSAYLAIKGYYT